ncbi:hypothetical protein ACWDR0_11115, partial [Streptomyces sp. NPDC003691]
SSMMVCALVPLTPKEEIPARRGRSGSAGQGRAAAVPAPESAGTAVAAPVADVAHHGYVTLSGAGRLEVTVESRSHGPASLTNATLRLAFSAPLARDQQLPPACLWGADRVVLCSTGALRVGGAVRRLTLDLLTSGTPDEVTVRVATHWNGGAQDGNPRNNLHDVLAPATGDPYMF